MTDGLDAMLTRLKLTAVRDRLDALLDEASRRELNLRETVQFLCEAEIAHKDQRRVAMGTNIAKFPFVRTLDGFEFDAQPSIDPKQIRELSVCRWSRTAMRSCCWARRAWARRTWPWRSVVRRWSAATRPCTRRR